MLNLKSLVGVVLLCCFSICLMAQDVEKKNRKNQNKNNEKSADAKIVQRLSKQIMANFKKVDLTDEQAVLTKRILDKKMQEIVKSQEAVANVFSKELRQKRSDALKQARDEGLRGKALASKANEIAGISEEVVNQWNEARSEMRKQVMEIRAEITDLLTDEQKSTLKKRTKTKKKKDGATKSDKQQKGDGKV